MTHRLNRITLYLVITGHKNIFGALQFMKQNLRNGVDGPTAFKAMAASQIYGSDLKYTHALPHGVKGKGMFRLVKEIFRKIKKRSKRGLIKETLLEVTELRSQITQIQEYTINILQRSVTYCGNDTALVRTLSGYVLCKADDHALLTILIEAGELERGTRILIEKYLQRGIVLSMSGQILAC